jgi:putative sigma-54 modulation protein
MELNYVQVNVSARHGSLSGHDQEIIREKAEKVRRLFDRVNAVEVTVDFQHREKPHVEINVSAEHTQDFVASATATTVVAALDGAIQKVEQQLRRHKEKLTGHKSTSVKHITPVEEED